MNSFQQILFFSIIVSLYSHSANAHTFDLEDKIKIIREKCTENEKAPTPDAELLNLCTQASEEKKLPNDEAALKATWFYGSPVHEKLTEKSIELSKIISLSAEKKKNKVTKAFIRGVFWNDDPTILLWSNKKSKKADTWGISWYLAYRKAKKEAQNNQFHTNGDNLLARSHFGDLQFLHAMASKDCEPAWKTLENMMLWAEFTYKVGTGRIHREIKIRDVPIKGIRSLFDNDQTFFSRDIISLFDNENTREAALGSLLHMIQDSYFDGHAQRENKSKVMNGTLNYGKGKIIEFHSYTNQDSSIHAKADEFPVTLKIDSILRNNLGLDPINHGSKILELAYRKEKVGQPQGASWEEVNKYLRNKVFLLENDTVLSGPGKRFRSSSSHGELCKQPIHLSTPFSSMVVSFESGNVSRNAAMFYDYLFDIDKLNTKYIKIDGKKITRLANELIKQKIIPRGYPEELNKLICKLNPKNCKKGKLIYSYGDSILVPDISLEESVYEKRLVLKTNTIQYRDESIKKIQQIGSKYELSSQSIERYKATYLTQAKNKKHSKYSNVDLKIKLSEFSVEADTSNDINLEKFRLKNFHQDQVSISPSHKQQSFKQFNHSPGISQNSICQPDENEYKAYLKENINHPNNNLGLDVDALANIAILELGDTNDLHSDFCDTDNNINAFSSGVCHTQKSFECVTTEKDHATHIAGIIGARKNGKGMVGVFPDAHMFKYNIKKKNKSLTSILKEADNKEMDIVNLSWGVENPKNGHRRALFGSPWFNRIKNSESMLFVIAAGHSEGNELQKLTVSSINDCTHLSICSAHLAHAITVSAANANANDILIPSRYGSKVIDIVAPGENILSTTLNGSYGFLNGTSQAAAFVSGAAGLIKSTNPNLFAHEIRERIMYTSDFDEKNISNKVISGKLNITRALDHLSKDVLKTKLGSSVYYGHLSYARNQKINLYPPGVDQYDEEKRHRVFLKYIKRIWYDKKRKNWTVMLLKDGKFIKYVGIKFQPSDNPQFQTETDKFILKTKGKKKPIALSNIKDLYVSAG